MERNTRLIVVTLVVAIFLCLGIPAGFVGAWFLTSVFGIKTLVGIAVICLIAAALVVLLIRKQSRKVAVAALGIVAGSALWAFIAYLAVSYLGWFSAFFVLTLPLFVIAVLLVGEIDAYKHNQRKLWNDFYAEQEEEVGEEQLMPEERAPVREEIPGLRGGAGWRPAEEEAPQDVGEEPAYAEESEPEPAPEPAPVDEPVSVEEPVPVEEPDWPEDVDVPDDFGTQVPPWMRDDDDDDNEAEASSKQ